MFLLLAEERIFDDHKERSRKHLTSDWLTSFKYFVGEFLPTSRKQQHHVLL